MAFVLLLSTVSRFTRVTLNQPGGKPMNKDTVEGKLKQLTGEIKRKWGRVTDDDLMEAQGSLDKMVGKIQERTGENREAIEKWFKAQGYEK
jgi:uncharacterized protein YjbJ (UPF0337 family)